MQWQYFQHECESHPFGRSEEIECHYEFVPDFVKENGYLPMECRRCYKALMFWHYSDTNAGNFKRMIDDFPISVFGKHNDVLVVFYFRTRGETLFFLRILKDKTIEFGVEGRIDWRVSGNYWQENYPQFFKSDKELKPIYTKKEVTMKEWVKRKGLSP